MYFGNSLGGSRLDNHAHILNIITVSISLVASIFAVLIISRMIARRSAP